MKKKKRRTTAVATRSSSDLGKPIWAMATHDDSLRHLDCTYDEAVALAKRHHGIVITNAAASRIHGQNDLANTLMLGGTQANGLTNSDGERHQPLAEIRSNA